MEQRNEKALNGEEQRKESWSEWDQSKWLTEEEGNYEVVEEGQWEREGMRGDL